jgi:hypothetical protein
MDAQDTSKFSTNDPILLAALNSSDAASPAGVKPNRSSKYRGVSKNKNSITTTWSVSAGTGGKSFNLGTYCTEEEAGLARNYGDELLRHPKPVKNVIPSHLMPDDITQSKVARTVVSLLRQQGVALTLPTAKPDQATPAPEAKHSSSQKPDSNSKPPVP